MYYITANIYGFTYFLRIKEPFQKMYFTGLRNHATPVEDLDTAEKYIEMLEHDLGWNFKIETL